MNGVFLSLYFASNQLPLISIAHLIRKLAGDAFSIFNENGQYSKVGRQLWLKFIGQLALIISRTMVAGAVPGFLTCMHFQCLKTGQLISNTVFTRIDAAALISFFTIQLRRLFEGGVYSGAAFIQKPLYSVLNTVLYIVSFY